MTADDQKAFADFVLAAISEEEWRAMSESSAPHEQNPPTGHLLTWHDRDMARVSAKLAKVRAERDELHAENRYVWNVVDREIELRCATEERLEAVKALHFPYDCTEAGAEGHETCGEREWCYSCGEEQPWPCTTYQALRN